MKKWWAKLLLGLGIILLVLLALFLSFSVHSKSAVDQYKDKLRAAGEILSFDELIPARPAAEKNGESLFNDASRSMNAWAGALESNPPPAMRMIAPGRAMAGWQQPEIVSLQYSGIITNTWDEIQLALQSQASVFDLLRQASVCPEIVFEVDYKQGALAPLNHLSKMRGAALLLSPAALNALYRGNSARAVTNIHTLLALVNSWKEPIPVSQTFRFVMAQIAVSDQWELLFSTKLADEQLSSLQNDWMKLDFIQPMEKSLMMQANLNNETIQQLRLSDNPRAILYGASSGSSSGVSSGDWLERLKYIGDAAKEKTAETVWRTSWSYSDELANLQAEQLMVESIRQVQTNGYFKDALAEARRKLAALEVRIRKAYLLRKQLDDELYFGPGSREGFSILLDKLLAMEAARGMTITAIALKRYQLRHGNLPADLNALVPELLPQVPRDPVDGKPLRYRSNGDGTFFLYSIGRDGVDNGGDPSSDGTSKPLQWLRGRDWVWPQPATPQEVQYYYDNPPK